MSLSQPSHAYIDDMNAGIARRAEAARRTTSTEEAPSYAGQEALWEAASTSADNLRDQLRELALNLHDHPEEAFAEHHAAAAIAALVRAHGHEVTVGVAGLDTALRSQWTSANFRDGDPTIGILAEYDALPGIGHGCGHNIIAAAGVGAYLAATAALSAHPQVSGRIVLLGTPAEEGHTGKEYMIRGGAFEDIDYAMMVHPFSYDVAEQAWNGRRTMTATFHGRSAHASSEPFMGRNALDAASLAYQGLGLLRQQIPPSDRLHAIITEGGNRPSVIPDTASLSLYVRSLIPEALMDLSARVTEVLDGAALMAGVDVDQHWDLHPASLPVRNNHTMAQRWSTTQRARGRDVLPAGVLPSTIAASTDFGNVSHLIPGIHPLVKIADESVALHTTDMAAAARTDTAITTAVDSAAGLAQLAIDLLADAPLRHAARAEFEQAGGRQTLAEFMAATPGHGSAETTPKDH